MYAFRVTHRNHLCAVPLSVPGAPEMTRKTFLALAVMLGCVMPAHADDYNVQSLHSFCKSPKASVRDTFCLGYFAGEDLRACGHISYGAEVQAFMNWVEKHPEQRTSPREFGVVSALSEAWPCPKP